MNVQGNFCAEGEEVGKRRHADGDVVSNASRFNDGLIGMLGQEFSAQVGDHAGDIVAEGDVRPPGTPFCEERGMDTHATRP